MRKSTKLKIFRRKKRSVILSVLKRHSLRQHTTVEVFDDMFRVNLYRNVQDNVNGGEKGGINGGDNFGDKARIREKAQKLTDIRKGTHAVL